VLPLIRKDTPDFFPSRDSIFPFGNKSEGGAPTIYNRYVCEENAQGLANRANKLLATGTMVYTCRNSTNATPTNAGIALARAA
jgi:hypothetical protein